MIPLTVVKTHAFGNDFLLVDAREVGSASRPALARVLCERHRGLGGDGVIFYAATADGLRGRFDLLNADGSYSELSGNGVRCLAAWLARSTGARHGTTIVIDTDAGEKRLQLLSSEGPRMTFRAAMGPPEAVAKETIEVSGQPVEAVTLRVGNPQCVVLGEVSEARLHAIASRLAVHPHFPEGTNVELAAVETPERVRILIWERGVGPTEASGTGACASAVAAMAFGGAARAVEVVSPGGTQRVEWTEEGLFLTGWAEVIAEARWLQDAS